jgi:uncharacterized protein (TIGR02569 family)
VLKPVDVPTAQLDWQAQLFGSLQGVDGLRVPRALRSVSGGLVVDGWCADTFLEGVHVAGRWRDIIRVGQVFHGHIADVEPPAFLGERDDPYAIADRVAWGELPESDVPQTKHFDRLVAQLRPVDGPSQLIHGDLTGNVLFHEELPPAVIDFAPYFRPPLFATAVVVADALVWEDAHERLVHESVARDPDFPQYFLRALIYRAVTDRLFRRDEPVRSDEDDPYLHAVDLALRLTR